MTSKLLGGENSGASQQPASGGGAIFYKRSLGKIVAYDDVPTIDPEWTGTNIDFQLDFMNEVDFNHVWGGPPSPIDTRTQRMEDSSDQVVLRINDQCFGTSTRESGKEVRILAANLLRTQSFDVLLDFSDITMVSSSYADELVAKLVTDPSIENVTGRLKTVGASDTIDLVIADAVRSRAANLGST